jgi:hypothetical protein
MVRRKADSSRSFQAENTPSTSFFLYINDIASDLPAAARFGEESHTFPCQNQKAMVIFPLGQIEQRAPRGAKKEGERIGNRARTICSCREREQFFYLNRL